MTVPTKSVKNSSLASDSGVAPEYQEILVDAIEMLSRNSERASTDVSEEKEQVLFEDAWHDWREIWQHALETVDELSHDDQLAAKKTTQKYLAPFFLGSPLWYQAITKPLGYPGDYRLMNFIYDGDLRGKTAFDRILHRIGLRTGRFVEARMRSIESALKVTLRGDPGRQYKVCSLGCGPAREISELVRGGSFADVDFILVDQDSGALRHAASDINQALEEMNPDAGRFRVSPRNVSVSRLLRRSSLDDIVERADLIYAVGLFDYFSDRTCEALVAALFERLAPDGELIIGNMKLGSDLVWPLEYICDWVLKYRSADEIVRWTNSLEGAVVELTTESTGHDYLLSVKRE